MIDIIIVLIILLSGVLGFKRGFFKEIVMTLGWLIVFILAWFIKDPIATFLSLNLPFIDFFGMFKGVTMINVIFYQVIAFIFIYSLLMIIYRIVLKITGAFEKILTATIILGIPSKILGFFVGLLQGYIIAFIFLFVVSQPVFNIKEINESGVKDTILEKTPVLSKMVEGANNTVKEIIELEKEYNNSSTKDKFNRECVKVMLKNKLVTTDYIKKLAASGKLKIKDLDEIIEEYDNK